MNLNLRVDTTMLKNKLPVLCLLALGCDRSGDDLVPQPNPDFDPVIEIGKLNTITEAQLLNFVVKAPMVKKWCRGLQAITISAIALRHPWAS